MLFSQTVHSNPHLLDLFIPKPFSTLQELSVHINHLCTYFLLGQESAQAGKVRLPKGTTAVPQLRLKPAIFVSQPKLSALTTIPRVYWPHSPHNSTPTEPVVTVSNCSWWLVQLVCVQFSSFKTKPHFQDEKLLHLRWVTFRSIVSKIPFLVYKSSKVFPIHSSSISLAVSSATATATALKEEAAVERCQQHPHPQHTTRPQGTAQCTRLL